MEEREEVVEMLKEMKESEEMKKLSEKKLPEGLKKLEEVISRILGEAQKLFRKMMGELAEVISRILGEVQKQFRKIMRELEEKATVNRRETGAGQRKTIRSRKSWEQQTKQTGKRNRAAERRFLENQRMTRETEQAWLRRRKTPVKMTEARRLRAKKKPAPRKAI